tara:strand:+ start:230 stop:784 length:555 start_codon:yes stop_codon:yes gene_type:complete
MAELYEDWVVRRLTAQEKKELSPDEKIERKRLQHVKAVRKFRERNPENGRKHYEANKEKEKERCKKYREEHTEKVKERHRKYSQTPAGKKFGTIAKWKYSGLQESKEELDRIYELYLHQELCYSCDVVLTRNGVCATDPCMDHSHVTNRFRQIACRSCNTMDSWMKYWVDGIYGGTKVSQDGPK